LSPRYQNKSFQTIDENIVQKHCGSKYQRGNGENHYQRGGTYNKNPVTAIGKLNLELHKVVDITEDFPSLCTVNQREFF